MRRLPRFLVGVTLALAAAGCAGVGPAHIAQTAGTIAGSALAPGIGAPIGSLVGLALGLLVQREVDKVTEQRERRELGDQLARKPADPSDAAAPQGEPVRVWVDEQVRDGHLIPGHFAARY